MLSLKIGDYLSLEITLGYFYSINSFPFLYFWTLRTKCVWSQNWRWLFAYHRPCSQCQRLLLNYVPLSANKFHCDPGASFVTNKSIFPCAFSNYSHLYARVISHETESSGKRLSITQPSRLQFTNATINLSFSNDERYISCSSWNTIMLKRINEYFYK